MRPAFCRMRLHAGDPRDRSQMSIASCTGVTMPLLSYVALCEIPHLLRETAFGRCDATWQLPDTISSKGRDYGSARERTECSRKSHQRSTQTGGFPRRVRLTARTVRTAMREKGRRPARRPRPMTRSRRSLPAQSPVYSVFVASISLRLSNIHYRSEPRPFTRPG